MFTKIQDKNGKITFFRSQQYDIGLYVIQDDDPAMQFNLDVSEQDFHKKIREDKAIKVIEEY